MKKVYCILSVALAFCAFLPFAGAQTAVQNAEMIARNGEWQEKEGFKYRKSISQPTTEGIYTITLESFTKGDLKLEAVPSDIVLVLDYSGSMKSAMGSGTTTTRMEALRTAANAFIDAIYDNDRYLPDDDDPTTPRIERLEPLGNRIGLVRFSKQNQSAYICDLTPVKNGGVNTLKGYINALTNPDGGTYADEGMTKAFELLKNRTTSPVSGSTATVDDSRKIRTAVLFTDGDPGSGNYWEGLRTVNGVTCLSANGETTWVTANNVINIANNIKNLSNEDKQIKSTVYTVSVINSPSDYAKVYLGKTSSNWSDATKMATLENYTYNGTTYIKNPVWNSSIWSNGNGTQVAGTEPANMGPKKYAFSTTNSSELKQIFEKIADESGGSEAQIGSSTVSQVDVVSASFALPDNATEDDIEVYTVRYVGNDASGNELFKQKAIVDGQGRTVYVDDLIKARGNSDTYTKYSKRIVDGQEVEVVEHNVDVDEAIQWHIDNSQGGDISQGAKPDRISVTGFDYANLWCGSDESVTSGEYAGLHQGYKLVVKIPIKMDDDAVGGPTLNTNGPGSGFLVDGELWAEFNPPQVSLPVNVHIQKNGLDVGESAKFTVQRREKGSTGDWIYVTSVFVTRTSEEDATPMVKIVGLPATDNSTPAKPYVYRVVEDNWNWAYKLTAIQDSEGHNIGDKQTRSATSEDIEVNPFIFINTKKTNIDNKVKNAESKALNVFLPGTTEGAYVDSKPRTATTSGTTTP